MDQLPHFADEQKDQRSHLSWVLAPETLLSPSPHRAALLLTICSFPICIFLCFFFSGQNVIFTSEFSNKEGKPKIVHWFYPVWPSNAEAHTALSRRPTLLLFPQEHVRGLPSDLLFQESTYTFPLAWRGGEQAPGAKSQGSRQRNQRDLSNPIF